MTRRALHHSLQQVDIPGESAAAERAWGVVREAFGARERIRWPVRRRGLVVALATAGAIAVAALTPPGQAVVDRVRDAVGSTPSQHALVRLPATGHLLVLSQSGPWVVKEDGSKRLLGDFEDASWSPRGLYVVAAQGERLVTLDPESGDMRWSLARTARVKDPRWSGGGLDTRIAFRAGSALHVVAGDGSPDAVLVEPVAPLAPAWKPDSHVLAYAGLDGVIHVLDVDSRRELWHTRRITGIRRLSFSANGELLVLTARRAKLYRPPRAIARVGRGHTLLDATVLPGGRVIYADYDRMSDSTTLKLSSCTTAGACLLIPDIQVFQGAGRIDDLVGSPDGRWLAAAWPEADQLLFFRLLPRIGRVVAASNIAREFSPGAVGGAPFPHIAGWAPAP
jgi:hypothetical protein